MSQSDHTASEIHGGFLKALLNDPSANTLAIGAAAMVPLIAMVGGGIDASRYYMAQSRLQAACDAGALAGRRAMETVNFTESQTQNEDDPSPQDISNTFFDQNYPDGTFGMEDLQRSFSSDNEGVVTGTATGKMPTTLMGMFGYSDVDLTVKCSANVNIANTDIVFVLDVTGSMQCSTDPSVACTQTYPGPGSTVSTDSKLHDLQEAAKDFYAVVSSAASPLAQVRYGFVPYNSQVNVGKILYAENPDWLASAGAYQSREAIFGENWVEISRQEIPFPGNGNGNGNGPGNGNGNGPNADDDDDDEGEFQYFQTDAAGNVNEATCANFLNDNYSEIEWFEVAGSLNVANAATEVVSQALRNRTREIRGAQVTERRGDPAYQYNGSGSPTCRVGWDVYDRTKRKDFRVNEELQEGFEEYEYKERTFDLTGLYDDDEMTVNIGFQGAEKTVQWDGCIEEVATARGQADFTIVPETAYDLNINHIPTSDNNTRWKPAVPGLVYYRYADNSSFYLEDSTNWVSGPMNTEWEKWSAGDFGTNMFYNCPTEAQRLKEMDQLEFDEYVDGLRAWGFTYQDTGMLWGARFISPNGLFAAENNTSRNGDAITRHIIFMTDGQQSSRRAAYNMYGIEWWDRRVSADGVQQTISDNHTERLQAACRAARNENISVWVVAFGTTLTQKLTDCATPGRAYEADNAEELSATFKEIAEKISALRLTE